MYDESHVSEIIPALHRHWVRELIGIFRAFAASEGKPLTGELAVDVLVGYIRDQVKHGQFPADDFWEILTAKSYQDIIDDWDEALRRDAESQAQIDAYWPPRWKELSRLLIRNKTIASKPKHPKSGKGKRR